MNLWLQNCAKGQTARCLVGQYWTWRRANKDSLPLRERARDALWSPPAGRQPAGQTDDELAGLLVRVPAAKWPASRRTAVYPSVSSLVWPPCSAEATPWATFGPPPPKSGADFIAHLARHLSRPLLAGQQARGTRDLRARRRPKVGRDFLDCPTVCGLASCNSGRPHSK